MQCRQEALRSDWYLNSIRSKKSKFQYLLDQRENSLKIITILLIYNAYIYYLDNWKLCSVNTIRFYLNSGWLKVK